MAAHEAYERILTKRVSRQNLVGVLDARIVVMLLQRRVGQPRGHQEVLVFQSLARNHRPFVIQIFDQVVIPVQVFDLLIQLDGLVELSAAPQALGELVPRAEHTDVDPDGYVCVQLEAIAAGEDAGRRCAHALEGAPQRVQSDPQIAESRLRV